MSSDQEQTDQTDQADQAPKSKIKTRRELDEQSGAVPPRQPAPSSIFAYVAVIITLFLFWGIVPGYPPIALDGQLAVSVFLRLLVVFLLINRSTIGWLIGAVIEGIYIIMFSIQIAQEGPDQAAKLWGLLFISIAAMALLLTRATRQHVFSPDPEVVAEQSGDPDAEAPDETDEDQAVSSSSSSGSSSST